MWQPQVDTLGQDFDLLVPDLGDTRPEGRFRVERAADAVADLIAALPGEEGPPSAVSRWVRSSRWRWPPAIPTGSRRSS